MFLSSISGSRWSHHEGYNFIIRILWLRTFSSNGRRFWSSSALRLLACSCPYVALSPHSTSAVWSMPHQNVDFIWPIDGHQELLLIPNWKHNARTSNLIGPYASRQILCLLQDLFEPKLFPDELFHTQLAPAAWVLLSLHKRALQPLHRKATYTGFWRFRVLASTTTKIQFLHYSRIHWIE